MVVKEISQGLWETNFLFFFQQVFAYWISRFSLLYRHYRHSLFLLILGTCVFPVYSVVSNFSCYCVAFHSIKQMQGKIPSYITYVQSFVSSSWHWTSRMISKSSCLDEYREQQIIHVYIRCMWKQRETYLLKKMMVLGKCAPFPLCLYYPSCKWCDNSIHPYFTHSERIIAVALYQHQLNLYQFNSFCFMCTTYIVAARKRERERDREPPASNKDKHI